MKWNYLLNQRKQNELCPNSTTGLKQHHYVPTGLTQATAGTDVSVCLECSRCDKREWAFVNRQTFDANFDLFTTTREIEQ